jgi:hypothetical protein
MMRRSKEIASNEHQSTLPIMRFCTSFSHSIDVIMTTMIMTDDETGRSWRRGGAPFSLEWMCATLFFDHILHASGCDRFDEGQEREFCEKSMLSAMLHGGGRSSDRSRWTTITRDPKYQQQIRRKTSTAFLFCACGLGASK